MSFLVRPPRSLIRLMLLIILLPFSLGLSRCPDRRPSQTHEALNAYHYHGQEQFFEGWYFKITLPEAQESFAFVYGVLNPNGTSEHSGAFLIAGRDGAEVSEPVFAADDLSEFQSSSTGFRTQIGEANLAFGDNERLHLEGAIADDNGEYSWNIDLNITAMCPHDLGWLRIVPELYTDWYIHAMNATASGWIQWRNKRFELEGALGYQEKNWGYLFPSEWYWLQANHFDDPKACCFSAAGGVLRVWPLKLNAWGIGFRYDDKNYSFNRPMEWARVDSSIEPGRWEITARKGRRKIIISGTGEIDHMLNLRSPTSEGMRPLTWETLTGRLRIRLYKKEKRRWVQIADTTSDLAGLEVGGERWLEWAKTQLRAE